MPSILALPKGGSQYGVQQERLKTGQTLLTLGKTAKHWQLLRQSVTGNEVRDVTVDALCSTTPEMAEETARIVQEKVIHGKDVCVLLYGLPDCNVVGSLQTIIDMCLSKLHPKLVDLQEAQEAELRLQQYREEEFLTTEALLVKRRQSVDGTSSSSALPTPSAPSLPPPHGRGRRSSIPNLQPQRSIPALQHRSSLPPTPLTIGLSPQSVVLQPQEAARRRRNSLGVLSLDRERSTSIESEASSVRAIKQNYMQSPSTSFARLVRRATEPSGLKSLTGKQGHQGTCKVLDFNGKTSSLALSGIKKIGEFADRLGIEFWMRTEVSDRKMTVVQLLGHKLEAVHIILNQDLNYDIAPGVMYIRIRDQLFNELEVQADTNEVLTNGRWHHVDWRIEDLRNDKASFFLDGVFVRVRFGTHTTPFKFDGWGTGDEEGFGAIGEDWKALQNETYTKQYPFRGNITECTLWGGETVLCYWPLTERSATGDDGKELQDMQGNSTVTPHNVEWKEVDFPQTSLSFRGNNYVNLGTLADFGSQMGTSVTIDLWFNSSHTDTRIPILGTTDTAHKRQGIYMSLNENEYGAYSKGSLSLGVTDTNGRQLTAAIHSASLSDGHWHHVMWALCDVPSHSIRVELDSKTAELKMGRLENPRSFINFTSFVCLGGHNNHGDVDRFFIGCIKAVKIWQGKGRSRSLLCFLRLDEGPGSTIAMDSSGNGHNGVLNRVPHIPRENPSFGRRRRSASILKLKQLMDVSYRHMSWLPLPLPIINNDDIAEEEARCQLLVKALNRPPSSSEDTSVKVAYLSVSSGKKANGTLVEQLTDCIHHAPIEMAWPLLGTQYEVALPDECWEKAVGPAALPGIIYRASEATKGKYSHQIVSLLIGTACVTFIQLQNRSTVQRLQISPSGKVEWSGPLQLAGAEAKRRHIVNKGVTNVESFLCSFGCRSSQHLLRAAFRSGHARDLGGCTIIRVIEWMMFRNPEGCSLVTCLQAGDSKESVVAALQLEATFSLGTEKLAALSLQKAWRGALGRARASLVKRRKSRLTSLRESMQSMAVFLQCALMQRYYARLYHFAYG